MEHPITEFRENLEWAVIVREKVRSPRRLRNCCRSYRHAEFRFTTAPNLPLNIQHGRKSRLGNGGRVTFSRCDSIN